MPCPVYPITGRRAVAPAPEENSGGDAEAQGGVRGDGVGEGETFGEEADEKAAERGEGVGDEGVNGHDAAPQMVRSVNLDFGIRADGEGYHGRAAEKQAD